MFTRGFQKTASDYSRAEHFVDVSEADAKHRAKQKPLHRGLATAVGATLGGAVGAIEGSERKPGTLRVRRPKGSFFTMMSYKRGPRRGVGKGAAIGATVGGGLGLLAAQLHRSSIHDAQELLATDPAERRGYLKSRHDHIYGKGR